jgi:histidinol-phosphate aminotransferase
MVLVPLAPGFPLPSQAIAAAVSERTRIVFVTNPHNPTGAVWNPGEIIALARQVAPVLLFVDEAYADFSATSLLDRQTLAGLPNVVIGRTFAKAFGLAALRAGALVGTPETLAPMRRLVPPYSLNAAAAAALPAALEDRAYTQWYIAQCAASRERLTEACRRLGFRALPSAANFMLVEVGPPAAALVAELARRGIAVRDRSGEAGCAGCVRMTTGVLDDTERLVTALEDAWRAVQR